MHAPTQVSATALAADGTTWVEYGQNTARFQGALRRLLIETSRINQVNNPRAEGVLSHWTIPTELRQSLTTATRNGVEGLLIRFAGVPSTTGPQALSASMAVSGAIGETWAVSEFVELVAGTLANVSGFTIRPGTEGGTGFTLGAFQRASTIRTLLAAQNTVQLRWTPPRRSTSPSSSAGRRPSWARPSPRRSCRPPAPPALRSASPMSPRRPTTPSSPPPSARSSPT
jgi:hypothetical protein